LVAGWRSGVSVGRRDCEDVLMAEAVGALDVADAVVAAE
jgi:hypothetical protein